MISIILHAEDQLRFVKYQKHLIKLNHPDITLIRKSPLWIPLFSDDKNLSDISKSIQKITIHEPVLKNDIIESDADILLDNKMIKSKLTILSVYKPKPDDDKKIIIKNPPDLSFPMDLNIFRIAETEKLSDNSCASTAFVWKKIR